MAVKSTFKPTFFDAQKWKSNKIVVRSLSIYGRVSAGDFTHEFNTINMGFDSEPGNSAHISH